MSVDADESQIDFAIVYTNARAGHAASIPGLSALGDAGDGDDLAGTNHRSSNADELVRLVPARKLSLDQALEFPREDECIEVTPAIVRLRRVALDQTSRVKLARAAKRG